jgi:hypothetical protein
LEQYRCVVNKYIGHKILHPDGVVICICGANDLAEYNRKAVARIPALYDTNMGGGFLSSAVDGVTYPTPRESYNHVIDKIPLVHYFGNTALTRLADHSAVLSAIAPTLTDYAADFSLFRKSAYEAFISNARGEDKEDADYHHFRQWFAEYAKGIKTECKTEGIPVRFFLLPDEAMVNSGKTPQFPDVISLDAKMFTIADYLPERNDHPNNEGHNKIFRAIKDSLDADKALKP